MSLLSNRVLTSILFVLMLHSALAQTTKPAQKPKTNTTKSTPIKKQPLPVDGFWLVTKVMVGSREITPVARWARLADGKHTTGNGWLQHSFGTYSYDKAKSELLLITANEPKDEFGPFKVTRNGPLMTWSRVEDDEPVVVELKPISEMPMSPSDEAKGLWVLEKATKNGEDITRTFDRDKKHYLFVRWDHQFDRQTNAQERISGYWFVNAHQPQMTLIPEGGHLPEERWMIFVEGQKMTMKGTSDKITDLVLVYRRASEFPK